MESKTLEKPFWSNRPWDILFDLVRLQKVRPWDVNLNYLLSTLLGEMRRRGYIDFNASGIALLSSATIYKMKTELVLKLEEPPKPPIEKPIEFIPPPIPLPYRYEYATITLDNLLLALEEALKTEGNLRPLYKLAKVTFAPPLPREVDNFLVNIEKKIEEMYSRIVSLASVGKIPFSDLNDGLSRLETIRVFLILLFLACRGSIRLWQDDEFGEIYVSLPNKGEENGCGKSQENRG
jgi:segregation and condensation protein A